MHRRGIYANRQTQSEAVLRKRPKLPLPLRVLINTAITLFVLSVLMVVALRWVAPPMTASMIQDRWFEGVYVDYRWMPLEYIAPKMRLAVIAAEDPRFMEHAGLDDRLLDRASRELDHVAPLRSGGTLTQQVARNLFLWQSEDPITRGLESYFAVLIDLAWSKQRILEMYLNTMEFGRGLYGVEAASQRYFHHSATRLGLEDASRLAAILPDPYLHSLLTPNTWVEERSEWIQGQMSLLGDEDYILMNRL